MKKNKLFKGMTVGAITIASIAAPLAATISCGSSTKKADLTVGIRPEDQPLWDNVSKEFQKATGKTVAFKWVTDQNANYDLWSGSNLMPDITIADSGVAKTGKEKDWFAQLDMNDLASNDDYRVHGTEDAAYAEKDIAYDDAHFSKNMMETMRTEGDTYNGMAVIYGPKITYAWKKLPIDGGHFFHIINDDNKPLTGGDKGEVQNLNYYVPDGKGGVVAAVDPATPAYIDGDHISNILFSNKPGHHRLQTTAADIQEFLTMSAAREAVDFNGDISKTGLTVADIKGATDATGLTDAAKTDAYAANQKLVISTGVKGYEQRFASVSKILFDKVTAADATNTFKSYLKVGAIQNSAFNFASLAYGDVLQSPAAKTAAAAALKAKWNLTDRNVLDDTKVFSKGNDAVKINFLNGGIDEANLSKIDLNEYESNFGYFTHGVWGGGAAGRGGETHQTDLFGKGESLIMNDGALWQWGTIKDKVEHLFNGQDADDLLTTFGQPYQTTGVDGYALKKGESADQALLAKKFLRFMMQSKAAADITGTKAKSTVIAAQKLAPELEGARGAGLAAAGTNSITDIYGGTKIDIPTEIAKTSSSMNTELNGVDKAPVFDPYNNYLMMATDAGIYKAPGETENPVEATTPGKGISLAGYIHGLNYFANKFKTDLDASNTGS